MSDSAKYKKRTVGGNITALIYLVVVAAVAFTSLYQGLSQYYAAAANASKSDSIASKAIARDPDNPDAYKIRGELLLSKNENEAALKDFESAVKLRPTDYILWLRLGYAHYKQGNFEEAEKAHEKAVSLAPNYAQPRWLTGWLHYHRGNFDRAVDYFNQAADLDLEYLSELLDLARTTFAGKAAIDEIVKPKSLTGRKTAAFYFIEHNIVSERNEAFLTGEELTEYHKNTYVSRLIAGKNFPLALAVWLSKRENKNIVLDENRILNGGFETDIASNEEGFGWQINRKIENVDFAVDEQGAFSGGKLLEIEFEGNSNPEELILSQLTLVEPNQSYRLTFAAAASELKTGGLPVVTVADINSGKLIGQSAAVASANGKWQKYTIDVRTDNSMKAVLIGIRRNRCDSNSCPAFGFLRLDGFELKKLN